MHVIDWLVLWSQSFRGAYNRMAAERVLAKVAHVKEAK